MIGFVIGDYSKKVDGSNSVGKGKIVKKVKFEEEKKIQTKEVLIKKPIDLPSSELKIEKIESSVSFNEYMLQSNISFDVIALIASNLTDFECMMKLSLASKEFHMAV